MKNLVLITSHYPFGTGESFIGQEIKYLSRNFEKIILISRDISGEKTRVTPENVTVYRYDTSTSLKGFLLLPFLFFINSGTIADILKREIEFRLGIKDKLTIKKFFFLFINITAVSAGNLYTLRVVKHCCSVSPCFKPVRIENN